MHIHLILWRIWRINGKMNRKKTKLNRTKPNSGNSSRHHYWKIENRIWFFDEFNWSWWWFFFFWKKFESKPYTNDWWLIVFNRLIDWLFAEKKKSKNIFDYKNEARKEFFFSLFLSLNNWHKEEICLLLEFRKHFWMQAINNRMILVQQNNNNNNNNNGEFNVKRTIYES